MNDFYRRQEFFSDESSRFDMCFDMLPRGYTGREVQISVLIKKDARRRQRFKDEWWVNSFLCQDDTESLPEVYETDQMKHLAIHTDLLD